MKKVENIGGNSERELNQKDEGNFFQRIGSRILNTFDRKKTEAEVEHHSEFYLLSEEVEPYGKDKKGKEWWKGVYKHWDDIGVDIPYDLGKMVEGFVENPDCVFGVHHSYAIIGENYENDVILHEILEEGLTNFGDASSGAIYKDPPVSKTVSVCPDMFWAVMQIKGSYKGSTGAVLLALPSEYVDRTGSIKPGMEDKVYNHNKLGNSIIKPEYILGFVQNLGRGSVCEFKTREELLSGYKEDQSV